MTAPGSLSEVVSHPGGGASSVEVAVFPSHRSAFFFWAQWTRRQPPGPPPCLVSIDWHQDLCYPGPTEKQWLDALDMQDDRQVAAFSWASLSSNNDDHILAAAYLNLIGDVYVLCRQRSNWPDEQFQDRFGNTHLVRKFDCVHTLHAALAASPATAAYLDVDLDYFALKEGYQRNMKPADYMSKAAIQALFDAQQPLMRWIYQRLAGFTIATEPEYCGGLLQSNALLDTLTASLFKPGLFAKNCTWRHLKKR